jgi:hypothetical protein
MALAGCMKLQNTGTQAMIALGDLFSIFPL